MPKPLIIACIVIVLITTFVAGFRFSQHRANLLPAEKTDRQILHYVDPMDPSHTSSEPGIAPCGMPMEPVYADDMTDGGSLAALPLGSVRLNRQKQQMIGVTTASVDRSAHSHTLRALGRVVPDENRTYAIIAGTDGWLGEVHKSTTGSLIGRDQLLAKIKIYDYDFFVWQQRYLTELTYSGRRRPFQSTLGNIPERSITGLHAPTQAEMTLPAPSDLGAQQSDNAKKFPHQSAASPALPTVSGSADAADEARHSTGTDHEPGPSDGAVFMQKTEPIGFTKTGQPLAKRKNPNVIAPSEEYYSGFEEIPEGPIDLPAEGGGTVEFDLPTGPAPELPTGPAPQLDPIDAAPALSTALSDASAPASKRLDPGHMHSAMPSEPSELGASETAAQAAAGTGHSGGAMGSMKEKPANGAAEMSGRESHQSMSAEPEVIKGTSMYIREDDIFYASKARQELLDLGVSEDQLAILGASGTYATAIELRSPVDGLVLARNVTPNQKINRGSELFRIADLSQVWIEADLFGRESRFIKPGMSALVSFPGRKQRYPATVSQVPPEFDGASRTLKVRLDVENPHYLFRPEMFVDVQIELHFDDILTIPASSVVETGERSIVYVAVDEGTFEPRPVRLGWKFKDRVEVISGLTVGEMIASSGTFLIDSESRMKLAAARLMEAPSPAAPETQRQDWFPPNQLLRMPQAPADEALNYREIDPICGMPVDPERTAAAGLVAEADGNSYYFCSEECLVEFHRHGLPENAPSRFNPLASAHGQSDRLPASTSQAAAAKTTTSVDPPVESFVDPVCSMTVDSQAARANDLYLETAEGTFYFCSDYCRERFAQDPQSYLTEPDAASDAAAAHHAHD